MKNRIVFRLFLLVFTFSCKSTYTKIGDKEANYIPYFSKMYEADSLYLVENYQRSYEILDSLFKKYEPVNSEDEYFTYITCKIMLDKSEKEIKKDFVYMLENFGDCRVYISLCPEKAQKFFTKTDTLGIDAKKALEKYKKSIDMPLRNLILSMTKKDQEPRQPVFDEERARIIDAENTRLLDSLIKINKFPSRKLVGTDTKGEISDVGAIMIHTKQEYKEQFLMEKAYELLKKGEISPSSYAGIYNRYNLHINDDEYYLTKYRNASPEEKKLKNERRKAIGLYSLDYISWKYKKKYNYEF